MNGLWSYMIFFKRFRSATTIANPKLLIINVLERFCFQALIREGEGHSPGLLAHKGLP